jgi:hypothetical protein
MVGRWNRRNWRDFRLSVIQEVDMKSRHFWLTAVIVLLWAAAMPGQLNVPQPQSWLYSHISTLTTTVVKSGTGVLHSVAVNAPGGVGCFVTLYDSVTASGTKIAVADCSGAKQLNYDVALANGLTVVTTSLANPDVTITFE